MTSQKTAAEETNQSRNRERKISLFENGKIKDCSSKKKPARCFASSRD